MENMIIYLKTVLANKFSNVALRSKFMCFVFEVNISLLPVFASTALNTAQAELLDLRCKYNQEMTNK